MGEKKQIAYYYDAKVNPDDTVVDMEGSVPVPEKGFVFYKRGERWRVEVVMKNSSGDGAVPVYCIYSARV